jgi:UDP-N-acetylmuramyl pentapeptide synthase
MIQSTPVPTHAIPGPTAGPDQMLAILLAGDGAWPVAGRMIESVLRGGADDPAQPTARWTINRFDPANGSDPFECASFGCTPVLVMTGERGEPAEGAGAFDADAAQRLLAALPQRGWAVLNGDVPRLRRWAAACAARTVWVGRNLGCEIAATGVHCRCGELKFQVLNRSMHVPTWGRHHLPAALAAVAVGRIAGLTNDWIAAGLARSEPPAEALPIVRLGEGTLIHEPLGRGPAATRASLELLREYPAPGRKIVWWMDNETEKGDAPRQVGCEVVTVAGADLLIACGRSASEVVAGASDAGMPSGKRRACVDWEESIAWLRATLAPGDVVLANGPSRAAVERVVHRFGETIDQTSA